MNSAPIRVSALKMLDDRLKVRVCRPQAEICETIPATEIDKLLREEGVILWVDILDPTAEDVELLHREFGFHHLALEDAMHQDQRAKVDEYPEYYFVVMHAPLPLSETPRVRDAREKLETRELDLFVGRNFLVSLHQGEIPALAEAARRWGRTDQELRHKMGFLLHTVIDSVIDGYFPLVDALEDRLDTLEMALFTGDGGALDDPKELLDIKRSLFTLRKAIYPLREVFNTFLRRDSQLFTAETYPYFQDVYDHILRLLDTVDIQRDMATGALDAHLAVVSNRLNNTMKQLTMVAVCVAILGAVFGAWGMNFTHVPLDHLGTKGFYLVSGSAVLLALGTVLLARWRKLW